VADTKVGDAVKIQIDKVMRRFAIGHKVWIYWIHANKVEGSENLT
jgi:hypothetical protein